VVLAFLAAVFSIGSLPAHAACSGATCPLVGGVVRYQIGNGLPFPASALLLGQPTGQLNTSMTAMGLILPLPGAVVSQGSTAPRSIMMPPSQLSAPQLPFTIPLFSANPLAFQLKTSIGFLFPSTLVTFSASGRVGPSTAAWCIDADPPAVPTGTPIGGFNPGCLGPNTTASLGTTFTSGLLRYTRTANQFGGVARAARPDGGTADIAINIAGIPALPCTLCTFGVQQIGTSMRNPTAVGASWGAKESVNPVVNSPGRFVGSINAVGIITNVIGPTAMSSPSTSAGNTTWGAPWTTGMVTASYPTAVPPEVFMITGTDQRTPGGEGTISLVAGAIATRGSTDPNVSRGWLQLTVPEPGTGLSLAAGAALMGLLFRGRLKRR
jgi:hypothetical protein